MKCIAKKKRLCTTLNECTWTDGKGCGPKGAPVLVPRSIITKICSTFYVVAETEVFNQFNTLLHHICLHAFRNKDQEPYKINTIDESLQLSKTSDNELIKLLPGNGEQRIIRAMRELSHEYSIVNEQFQAVLEKTYGIKFKDSHVALYFAAILETLVEDILEVVVINSGFHSNDTSRSARLKLDVSSIITALEDDDDINEFLDMIGFEFVE